MASASVEGFDNLTRDDAGSLLGGMEGVVPEEGIYNGCLVKAEKKVIRVRRAYQG